MSLNRSEKEAWILWILWIPLEGLGFGPVSSKWILWILWILSGVLWQRIQRIQRIQVIDFPSDPLRCNGIQRIQRI